MTKNAKLTIIATVVAILGITGFILWGNDPMLFSSSAMSESMVALATFAGIVGGLYPATRAMVRLVGGPLMPAVPIPGDFITQCVVLAVGGLCIGLIAPLWAAASWALGAAILFVTKGLE